MKQGDKARSKTTQFTGTIARLQTRIVDGVIRIERVLILGRPGARMWVSAEDVELLDSSMTTGVK